MDKGKTRTDNKNYKISEKQISDYVLTNFQKVKRINRVKELVSFQTANKYMLMSHDQTELKILGNIVASYKKNILSEILHKYEEHLKIAMNKEPTIKTHINVIMHIFGYFSAQLNQNEKELFFRSMEQFREGKLTIGNILTIINPIVFRFNNTYLASQTYFLLYSDIQPVDIFQFLNKKQLSTKSNPQIE